MPVLQEMRVRRAAIADVSRPDTDPADLPNAAGSRRIATAFESARPRGGNGVSSWVPVPLPEEMSAAS